MNDASRLRLRDLMEGERVLALSVLVDGNPYIGLLPYALTPDFSAALVHASGLARHTRGLYAGAPFAILIHVPDTPDADPLQILRVTLAGKVRVVEPDASDYAALRDVYVKRLPGSEISFDLGDFKLFELRFREGRFVEGFAAASNITPDVLRQLAQ